MIYTFDTLSFQIVSIDRFVHREGVFDVSARPYAALSYRVSGTASFEVGGLHLTSRPGDVLFLPADMPYRVEYSVSESIVVHLAACNYTVAENTAFKNGAGIHMQFSRLLEAWRQRHSVNQAKSLLYGILECMSVDQVAQVKDTAADLCIRYMNEHFCDPELSIERVCEAGFISISGLQRAMTRGYGTSPKQYLIRLRMKRAWELLTEHRHTVREIAFLCGFTDEKYFSRAFKKMYGYPPSQLKGQIMM